MAACRMTLEKVVQVEGVEVSLDALWTTPEGHTTYPFTTFFKSIIIYK